MWLHVLIGDLAAGIRDLVRGSTAPHERLRRRLATALLLTLLVDAVATGLMYWLEHAR